MAISFVSFEQKHAASGATTLAADAVAHVGGHLLVVCARTTSSVTISGISDTAGNVYTPLPQKNAPGIRMRQFYCLSCLGHPANVVTVTFSGSSDNRAIEIVEFAKGSARDLRFVLSLEALPGGATPTSDAFNTPHNSTEAVIVATYIRASGSASVTAGTDYTLLHGDISTSDAVEYRTTTSTLNFATASFGSADAVGGILLLCVFADYPGIEPLVLGSATGAGQSGAALQANPISQTLANGDDIVAFVTRTGGGGGVAIAPTDSAGNTYVHVASSGTASWNGAKLSVWRATGIVGGAGIIVTANYSASVPFAGLVVVPMRYLGAYNGDFVEADQSAPSAPSPGQTLVAAPDGSIAFAVTSTNDASNNLFPAEHWLSGNSDRQNDNSTGQDLYTAHRRVDTVFTGSFLATSPPANALSIALSFAGVGPHGGSGDDDPDEGDPPRTLPIPPNDPRTIVIPPGQSGLGSETRDVSVAQEHRGIWVRPELRV